MADYTVTTDIDTFMQSADKAAMRTNMDLGTAATKDVAASGDAASGEVVKGDDTRLTDARTPTSHTHTASEVTDFDTEVANNTTVAANTSKLAGIDAGAEVNNISDVNATDLTDGGDSTLHYHAADRARTNHTGTQTLSTISDAGTAASKDVPATGDAGAGEVVLGNDSRLTDARTPTSHTHTASEITDFDTEVTNNTTVAANTSKLAGIEAGAEVNNISDVNATDLTDGGDSSLHYHSADRNRSNHTGTQTLATISDAGTIASQDANSVNITGGSVTGITDLAIADGGTGAGTAAGARTNLDVYSTGQVDEYLGPKATAGGVRFDGSSGTAVIADGGDFGIENQDKTFSFYFKSSDTSSTGYVIAKGSRYSGGFGLQKRSSTGYFRIYTLQDSSVSVHSLYELQENMCDGIWHHIVLMIDGTTSANPSFTLYVDGQSKSLTTLTSPNGTYGDSTDSFSIAARGGGADLFSDMEAKDLSIFNRALTASEVADLYRNGLAGIADADRWGSGVSVTGTTTAGFQITDNGGSTTSWDFTATGTPGIYEIRDLPLTVVAGQKYICSGSVTTLPATGDLQILLAQAGVAISNIVTLSSTGSFSEVLTVATTSTVPRIYIRILNGTGSTTVGNIDGIKQLGAIAAYPMDEGIGYQLHDISSNHYDGLLSTSGFTHLLPKTEGKARVKAANASSAMYMLRAGDILPQDTIVDNVLSENRFVDLTNSAQTLDDYRIRLEPSGSDLLIRRSDGSNHQTLGTVTSPSSLSDVDVEIQYTQVAR